MSTLESLAAGYTSGSYSCPLFQKQYEIETRWLRDTAIGQNEFILLPVGGLTGKVANNGTNYLTIFSVLTHPFSRGWVHVNTSDPLAPPKINPRYLSEPIDVEQLLAAARFAKQVPATLPLSLLVHAANTPSVNVTGDAFTAYCKSAVMTLNHPIGTCAMAPEPLGGVVNSALVVYGTENVRVIDASVLPLQTASHPMTAVYAVAERVAEMIKQQYGL